MAKWKSISTKILISYLSVVVFTFLVTALAFYPILVGVLERRAEIGLQKQAWEIAYTLGAGALPPDEVETSSTIPLLGRAVESGYLWIDPQDTIIFSSHPQHFPVGLAISQLPESLREDRAFDRSQANIFKNDSYLIAEVPVSIGGTVLTFLSISTLQAMYRETLQVIFGSLLVALIMALLIAFFLISYLVKPLRSLEDYARAVGNRQFDRRLKVNSYDELDQLATAFNEMTARLKSYDESRRRFFQNASHELKTPLMSINGYAEGIRDGLFTGPDLDKAIDIIRKESMHLKNVVENMIDITTLEQPHNRYLLPHDLSYIMKQVMETVGGYALEQDVLIELEIPPRTWVIGDWDQLHSLFANLLSNAIRHATSKVTVHANLVNGNNIIKVEDDGAGFSPKDLSHAFDYFYTGVKSGSGLGLTIVHKIVAEHAGTIKIFNAAQGGAVVEIFLPAVARKR
ncbi:MAG: HAMP domain-containing sensor histidine kinase [Desulfotomaculaceae bacterium]|nr:HAMP domain-containing sensor histidine kinase [Desulfotomaculaceae bacterium]